MIDWIASYPKSGNTWLRMFLDAYRNGGALVREIMTDPNALDTAEYHYHAVSPVPLISLSAEQLMQLRGAALIHAYRCRFLKTHWARCNAAGVESIPDSLTNKAVYIVRDPRIVCGSLAGWMDKTLDEAADLMANPKAALDGQTIKLLITHMGTWSFHVSSWMDHEDTLLIRYEDMVADPVGTFTKVIEHIGGELDRDVLDKAIEATRFDRLKAYEGENGFLWKPKGGGSFFGDGAKRTVPPEIAARIEADHGEVMKKLGYI